MPTSWCDKRIDELKAENTVLLTEKEALKRRIAQLYQCLTLEQKKSVDTN